MGGALLFTYKAQWGRTQELEAKITQLENQLRELKATAVVQRQALLSETKQREELVQKCANLATRFAVRVARREKKGSRKLKRGPCDKL